MKKTGNFLCTTFIILLSFFVPVLSSAQPSVSVNASISETSIYVGENVQFSIKITGNFKKVSRPDIPDIKSFRLLSNVPSVSRSFRSVNGNTSTSYGYSYALQAEQQGDYTIPSVSVTIDGKSYQTDPISVSVVKRGRKKQSLKSTQQNIFLRMHLSHSQPFLSQQIIADVMLYFKEGMSINSYQPVTGWKAQGFWKENLQQHKNPQVTSTIINGVRYRKARLMQFSLFPTQDGKLKVSPYKIKLTVRKRNSSNNPFGGFFGNAGSQPESVELQTKTKTIHVKPLPADSAGMYLGAVGNFHISRSINTHKAKAGETVEIKTTLKGSGNLPLISKPSYNLPSGLEIYQPEKNTELKRDNHKISGEKTFTDIIVPRTAGNYTIPAQKVSFFNPLQKKYVTTTLAALHFKARPADAETSESTSQNKFPIQPITGLASWITTHHYNMLSFWWLWAGLLIPVGILGLAFWRKRYNTKMNTNVAFARSRKAWDKASGRLDQAIELSKNGNIKQAYGMLQKAITGFISDRLTLAEAGLSNEEYVQALKNHGVDKELVKNVSTLLDKCDSISYAPSTSHEYLKSHVGLAESTLKKLQKVL